MPYDEKLAENIRKTLHSQRGVVEKKMFGGLAFLLNGNMCITVSAEGGILARVDPDDYQSLCSDSGVEVAVMRGRPVTGWLRVSETELQKRNQLRKWIKRSVDYTSGLPAKVK